LYHPPKAQSTEQGARRIARKRAASPVMTAHEGAKGLPGDPFRDHERRWYVMRQRTTIPDIL